MGSMVDTRRLDVATDLHAERSVLGILLRNSELFAMLDRLRAEHFFLEQHRLVYEAIERLLFSGQQADPIAVYDDMRKRGDAKKIDGRDFLFQLMQKAGAEQSLETHAEIVRERAQLRAIRLAAGRAQEIAVGSTGMSAGGVLEGGTNEFTKISGDYSRNDPVSVLDVYRAYVERLDRIQHGEEDTESISTGLPDMDMALNGGLKRGKLYYIGARPSMGKTALALNWAAAQSISDWSVMFHSLEMPREELMIRLMGIWGSMKTADLERGKPDALEWDRLTTVALRTQESKLWIDDDPVLTLADLNHKARKQKRLHGLDVLYVDYLQLMTGPEQKRVELLGTISRGLKRLAKSLDCAVVALSQLNRAVESRPDKRPILSDLRECGDLEQDADVVLMPYRESMDRDDVPFPDVCDVFIRKQRGGALGTVSLKYEAPYTRFVTLPEFERQDRERIAQNRHKRSRGFQHD